VQIWGEGPVSIFRDGQRYDGIWRRWHRGDMLSFWTKDGSQRLPLKPGNSWFQMVPLGFTGLISSPPTPPSASGPKGNCGAAPNG
jgi:hypothetical protein